MPSTKINLDNDSHFLELSKAQLRKLIAVAEADVLRKTAHIFRADITLPDGKLLEMAETESINYLAYRIEKQDWWDEWGDRLEDVVEIYNESIKAKN